MSEEKDREARRISLSEHMAENPYAHRVSHSYSFERGWDAAISHAREELAPKQSNPLVESSEVTSRNYQYPKKWEKGKSLFPGVGSHTPFEIISDEEWQKAPKEPGDEGERAWAYLVKDHPWVAKNEYYKDNPTKSATFNAFIAGVYSERSRSDELRKENEELKSDLGKQKDLYSAHSVKRFYFYRERKSKDQEKISSLQKRVEELEGKQDAIRHTAYCQGVDDGKIHAIDEIASPFAPPNWDEMGEIAAKDYAREAGSFPGSYSIAMVNGHTRGWDDAIKNIAKPLRLRSDELRKENERLKAMHEVCVPRSQMEELQKKGESLCQQNGELLIAKHDLESDLAVAKEALENMGCQVGLCGYGGRSKCFRCEAITKLRASTAAVEGEKKDV